jgi:pantothenate kinase-related protein Tda10
MLDFQAFYQACNPTKTIDMGNEQDRKYYIDFSKVRGSDTTKELERTITRLSGGEPTCQLFSGHIGCGKSTELFRLKDQLVKKGYHVVYFESSEDLDMADVDISDILLAIARQVSESLQKTDIHLQPKGFKALLKGAADILQTSIELSGEAGIGYDRGQH